MKKTTKKSASKTSKKKAVKDLEIKLAKSGMIRGGPLYDAFKPKL